jgi:hypothetical protein
MHDVKNHRFKMVLRHRGRPSTTTDADRARNYQDAQGNYALGELKPWHVRVVDHLLAHPNAKIVDVAKAFDVTPQWIGRLMKSDSFKEYFELRLREHQDMVSVEVVSKMQHVATKALDHVAKKIETGEVKFAEALDAADLALKGLGYTASRPVSVNVANSGSGNTAVMVDAGSVDRARAKMLKTMRLNSEQAKNDPDNYSEVTASLELTESDVEDAEVVEGDDRSISGA